MTDSELLELAAFAADYMFTEKLTESAQGKRKGPFISHRQRWKQWNPLTDDGDALRLAVKLGLVLKVHQAYTVAEKQWHDGNHFQEVEEHVDNRKDRDAATRRAIVRAAAEIGKAMK